MQLELIKGWDGSSDLISDKPTEPLIAELVNSLDWQQFNAVTLRVDHENWINVSGNLSEDGLALVYEENGDSTVSDVSPTTIEDLIKALQSYLKGDQQYKQTGFSSSTESKLKQKLKDIELRKIQSQAKRKNEKRNYISTLVASSLIVALVSTILYLHHTDELKFVGHQTDFTTASVTETKWKSPGVGGTQIVIYEFELHGAKYRGYFNGTDSSLKHNIGDLIRIKISTDDPSISKRIATLKRKRQAYP